MDWTGTGTGKWRNQSILTMKLHFAKKNCLFVGISAKCSPRFWFRRKDGRGVNDDFHEGDEEHDRADRRRNCRAGRRKNPRQQAKVQNVSRKWCQWFWCLLPVSTFARYYKIGAAREMAGAQKVFWQILNKPSAAISINDTFRFLHFWKLSSVLRLIRTLLLGTSWRQCLRQLLLEKLSRKLTIMT